MKKETNPSKIVVQHLNLHYGENHALKDINMNIAQMQSLHLSAPVDAESLHF